MILELKSHGNLPPDLASQYREIYQSLQAPYFNLLDSLSARHGSDIAWWISASPNRNTIASPAYHYLCCAVLVGRLLAEGMSFLQIKTDSPGLAQVLTKSFAGPTLRVELEPDRRGLWERVRKSCAAALAKSLARGLLHLVCARLTKTQAHPPGTGPIILIDTFVGPGLIEKDRFYPGLEEHLPSEAKELVYFLPSLFGFRLREYLRLFKQLRRSPRHFLLKEDFLRLPDLVKALDSVRRAQKIDLGECRLESIDVTPILAEEMRDPRVVGSQYEAMLTFLFFKRLRQARVQLRLALDWFENQIVDKGFNAGVRWFFPRTRSKGYQGYLASPHYLGLFITRLEMAHRVVPEELVVFGRGFIPRTKRYCPELVVGVAPAFRFSGLWNQRRSWPAGKGFHILVALSIDLPESLRIIDLVVNVSPKCASDVRFRFKPHPDMTPEYIRKQYPGNIPLEMEFVSGDFGQQVETAHLLISAGTGACLESIAKGIPVIVLGNRHGLTHNPIPEQDDESLWRICYGQEELIVAIDCFRAQGQHNQECYARAASEFLSEHFESVTAENVVNLLELGD